MAGTPPSDFTPPDEVVTARINPDSGVPSSEPSAIDVAFLAGSEPQEKTRRLESIFIEDDAAGNTNRPKAAN